ncbi:MAG: CrcB family protein [Alphaproteobacteria bacterium]|nr:CrcB family protein [Alphaproteobacteria bacterium]
MAKHNDPSHREPVTVTGDPALVTVQELHHRALRNVALIYLAVGAGSIVGGVTRWLVAEAMHAWFAAGPPWATLFVNVTGSFLIGLYVALAGPGGRLPAGTVQRHFAMTGICGGYTTFSIFSLETVRLFEAGQLRLAALGVAASLAGWLGAVWCGYGLGMRLNRHRR